MSTRYVPRVEQMKDGSGPSPPRGRDINKTSPGPEFNQYKYMTIRGRSPPHKPNKHLRSARCAVKNSKIKISPNTIHRKRSRSPSEEERPSKNQRTATLDEMGFFIEKKAQASIDESEEMDSIDRELDMLQPRPVVIMPLSNKPVGPVHEDMGQESEPKSDQELTLHTNTNTNINNEAPSQSTVHEAEPQANKERDIEDTRQETGSHPVNSPVPSTAQDNDLKNESTNELNNSNENINLQPENRAGTANAESESALSDSEEQLSDTEFDVDETLVSEEQMTIILARTARDTIKNVNELNAKVRHLHGIEYVYTNEDKSRFYIQFRDVDAKKKAEKELRGSQAVPYTEIVREKLNTKSLKIILHTGKGTTNTAAVLDATKTWIQKVDPKLDPKDLWVEPNKKESVYMIYGLNTALHKKLIKEATLEVGGKCFGATASTNGLFRLTGFVRPLKPSVKSTLKILNKMGITPNGPIYVNRDRTTLEPRGFASFNVQIPYGTEKEQFFKTMEEKSMTQKSKATGVTFTFKIQKAAKKRGKKDQKKNENQDEVVDAQQTEKEGNNNNV